MVLQLVLGNGNIMRDTKLCVDVSGKNTLCSLKTKIDFSQKSKIVRLSSYNLNTLDKVLIIRIKLQSHHKRNVNLNSIMAVISVQISLQNHR